MPLRLGHTFLASLLLALACSRPTSDASATPSSSPSSSAAAAPEASSPLSLRPAWTVATTLAHPPVPLAKGVAGVVAHVPEGLDASQPLHLVLFFHGSDQCVAQIAMAGDIVCRPDVRPDVGAGLAWRHDDAGTGSIFAAPQFTLWGGGTAGRMGEAGYFRSLVEELLHDTFAPGLGGPRTLDDLADITIVAHSAGHVPLAALLERGDLDDKVKNVILLDATYDGMVDPYARWLERGLANGNPRKLVVIHGRWGSNAGVGRILAGRAEAHARGSSVIDPPGPLADAVRTHTVTVKGWPHLQHAWLLFLTMSKALEGLGLPPRAISPPRIPYGEPPLATPMALGQTREGALDEGHAFLDSGSLFDDYALDLEAGQHAVIDLRGGHSSTEPCCNLDVYLEILQDGKTLARDDDSGGFFDAHLDWVAPARGRYVVRASTYGSGRKRGPYSLRIADGAPRASPP
jgi:hypothetical protein